MVSADTGLKLTLPSSFTQNSFSMNSLTTASNPAATSASATRLVRAVFLPPGAPGGALRLDGDDHVILGAEPGRVALGARPRGVDLAAGARAHAQPAGANRLEVRAARDHGDVVLGTEQPRRHQTTDGAGAVD